MFRISCLALLALLGSGCSALGLTDVTPQEPCRECADLNAIEPPGACMSWQCGQGGFCVVGPTDGDGDGAPLEACAPANVEPDCDDDDSATHPATSAGPAATELPDGKDNDCDETVDENVGFALEARIGTELEFVSWSDAGGQLLAIAGADGGTSVRLLTREDGSPAFVNLVAAANTSEALRARASVALAPVGALVVVAGDAVRGAGVCQPPYVGRVTPPAAGVDVPIDGSVVAGFPRSEACDEGGGADPRPLDAIAVAAHDERRALLVGIEGGGDRATCGATGAGAATALVLRQAGAGEPLTAIEEFSIVLGQSAGIGGPAALAIPEDSPVFRYLVAFADDAGAVQVHRVQSVASGGAPVVESELLHTEPSCGAACGDVHLTATTIDGARVVGLAYRAGTCASPEVRFRRLAVSASGLRPVDDAPLAIPAPGVQAVAISARTTSPEWAVAFSSGGVLDVQLVDADGLRGAPASGFVSGDDLPTAIDGAIGISYTVDRIELGFLHGPSVRFARLPLR